MRLQTMRVVHGVHLWGLTTARERFGMRTFEIDRQISRAEEEEGLRLFLPRTVKRGNWFPAHTMAGGSWLSTAETVVRAADDVLAQAGAFRVSEPNPRNVTLEDCRILGHEKLFRYSPHKQRARLEDWLGLSRLYDRHLLTTQFQSLMPAFAVLAKWIEAHNLLMDHVYEKNVDHAPRLPVSVTGSREGRKSHEFKAQSRNDEAASAEAEIEAVDDVFSADVRVKEGGKLAAEAVR